MKNIIKRIAMVIMAIVVMFTAVNPTVADAATKKAKLNETSITLKITDKKANPSATLKVKNAKKSVKWITSDKKVAAIKKTGKNSIKVTAKKAGKATITCKVDGKKLTCKVTVKDKRKPAEPTPPANETDPTATCTHDWKDHWTVFEDEGDIVTYEGEDAWSGMCYCGVFTSEEEFDRHLMNVALWRGLCTKQEKRCGIHGTKAKPTGSSDIVSDGEKTVDHWTIRTEYIDYMYCTKCDERITNPFG